jgi:hypothetical protein
MDTYVIIMLSVPVSPLCVYVGPISPSEPDRFLRNLVGAYGSEGHPSTVSV